MDRRGFSALMAFFTIAVLAVLVSGLVFLAMIDSDRLPLVGERQQAVLDAYQRADSIRAYAGWAAQRAVERAVLHGEPEALASIAGEELAKRLSDYPGEHLYAPMQAQETLEGVRFTSTDAITLPLRMRLPEAQAQSAVGPFDSWPVAHPPELTSLFGLRIAGGSATPNTAGIDIAAPPGTDVLSLAEGTVRLVGSHTVWIEHATGVTCGYIHVDPAVSAGAVVAKGERIAGVQRIAAPHLDLRCYNHVTPLSASEAENLFGSDHAGPSGKEPPRPPTFERDTTLAVTRTDNAADPSAYSFIDPYCLFTQPIKDRILEAAPRRADPQAPDYLSGYDYRPYGPIPSGLSGPALRELLRKKLEHPCTVYASMGQPILPASTANAAESLAEDYVESMILHTILQHETYRDADGNLVTYSDTAGDRGGATNWGVTIDTLRAVEGPQVTEDDVRALTRERAVEIYRERYFYGPGIDKLPQEITPQVFDMHVNMGANAFYVLKEVLRGYGSSLSDDRRLDDATIAAAEQAVAERGPGVVNNDLVDRRRLYYERIVERDPTQRRFLDTWLYRAESYRDGAANTVIAAQALASAGTYEFSLDISVPLTSDQRRVLQGVADMRERLARCAASDDACIQAALADAPVAYGACNVPDESLGAALSRCDLLSGCSCPLPVGAAESVLLGPEGVQVARLDGTVDVPVSWLGPEGEDIPLAMRLSGVGEGSVLADPARGSLMLAEALPTFTGAREAWFGDHVWVHAETNLAGLTLVVSGQNATAACVAAEPRAYCAGDVTVWVDHPLASLPGPST